MRKNLLIFLFVIFRLHIFSQNYYDLGCVEYFKSNNDSAVKLFNLAIKSGDNLSKSYMMRGATYIYMGNFANAFLDLKTSIDLDSVYYKTYFYYGKAFFMQEFYSSALIYFEKAASKYDKDPVVFDNIAITKIKLGNYEQAVKNETKAILLNPNKPDYYINRAFAKTKLKQYDDALNDINKSLLIGNEPKSYSIKGSIYAALGNDLAAIENFNIAIKMLPNAMDLYYFRGLSLKKIGKLDEACVDFAESKKLGYSIADKEFEINCVK